MLFFREQRNEVAQVTSVSDVCCSQGHGEATGGIRERACDASSAKALLMIQQA